MSRARTRVIGAASVAVVTLLTASCTSHGRARTTSTSTKLGAASCAPPSPVTMHPATGLEVQGTGHGATLYGLIMVTQPMPIRVGEDVKIVWRMTGSGPLTLSTTSPQGGDLPVAWGPEQHGGSNYDRPGQEWGAGYHFAVPGCWRLHAQRTAGSADVWLNVKPR